MGSRIDAYVEAHSLEFDLEHSDCKDCYSKHLECLYYYGKCRNEVWVSYKLWGLWFMQWNLLKLLLIRRLEKMSNLNEEE